MPLYGLYETWKQSPQAALDRVLDEYPRGKLLWQCQMGTDGVGYGSYQTITRRKLEGRRYEIQFSDGMVAIYWLDMTYDTRTHQKLPFAPATVKYLDYLAYRLECQKEDVRPSDWVEFRDTFLSSMGWL